MDALWFVEDLVGAALRGGISAAAVAAVLLVSLRWGQQTAGLWTGLPTVTGPALWWLALDHGPAFASEAARGAVLAGASCALFALVYGVACLALGRLASVALASAASLPPLLLLVVPPLWPGAALALVAALCGLCVAVLPRVARQRGVPRSAASPLRACCITAMVSGVVSALASLLAPHLSPLWAGALTSPPLLAAAVAWELHRQGCPARVLDFLRGYTAGLVGRGASVTLFGALLLPAGLLSAVGASLVLALVSGWVTAVWMKSRLQGVYVQRANP